MGKINVLDCTLRDGGWVNNWNWNFDNAKSIIKILTKAKIDNIEVGFLRNVKEYNPDITACNTIEELNKLLPEEIDKNIIYAGMILVSNYDINKLTKYSGKGIEMIRIVAHDYDIEYGLEVAKKVKEL